MVIGYHLIWTAYGWWLPNDPRGSMSHEIRVEKIANLGELHYGRKRIQPSRADLQKFFVESQDLLHHEPKTFAPEEFPIVAECLGDVVREHGYTCYACAVMPDHVHMLIRRHRDKAETMLEHLQAKSRATLIDANLRGPTHPVWGGPGWKVFLDRAERMEQVVQYIRNNPIKIGLPEQYWNFVTKYDGWVAGYRG